MFFNTAIRQAAWLNAQRAVGYPRLFLCFYVALALLWISNAPIFPKHDNVVFAQGFVNIYAAGVAAHQSNPAGAYDFEAQTERERHIEDVRGGARLASGSAIPWLYPPMFLGIAWLLAFLPYYTALGVYLAAGAAAYSVALYKLSGFKKSLWALFAFPGLYTNLYAGQNGALTAALLAAGFFFLEETPIAAGVFFGLISYKPQFFILIPLALGAGRYWKALIATCVSAFICAALSLAAFGHGAWQAFFTSLTLARKLIFEDAGGGRLSTMHTVFSMSRILGADTHAAYIAQITAAILAIAFLLWIWSRRTLSLNIKGAALVAVALLASPYSFFYDEVILAVALTLLVREGVEKSFIAYEKILLFALWLLPVFMANCGAHYKLPLTPLFLTLLIFICWQKARQQNSCAINMVRRGQGS